MSNGIGKKTRVKGQRAVRQWPPRALTGGIHCITEDGERRQMARHLATEAYIEEHCWLRPKRAYEPFPLICLCNVNFIVNSVNFSRITQWCFFLIRKSNVGFRI